MVEQMFPSGTSPSPPVPPHVFFKEGVSEVRGGEGGRRVVVLEGSWGAAGAPNLSRCLLPRFPRERNYVVLHLTELTVSRRR